MAAALALSDDFLSGANVVEIAFLTDAVEPCYETEGYDVLPIAFRAPPQSHKLPRTWRRHAQKLIEYSHKNMCYSYDLANDAQRNVTRSTLRDVVVNDKYYLRALSEDVLPCHQFPCTTEVHHVAHIVRTLYTIHNRLVFTVDAVHEEKEGAPYYTCTLRYTHADNADRTKIKDILFDALLALNLVI